MKKASLNSLSQYLDEKVFPLEKFRVTIGRSSDNDITVRAPSISTLHAHVLYEREAHYLEDCNSANGTKVNGKKFEGKHELYAGDTILFGDQLFIYKSEVITKKEARASDLEEKKPKAKRREMVDPEDAAKKMVEISKQFSKPTLPPSDPTKKI